MLLILTTFIFVGIPLLILYLEWKWARIDAKTGIRGLKTVPILGNLPDLKNMGENNKST